MMEDFPTEFDRGRRNVSGCGLTGFVHLDGSFSDGRAILESIAILHDRANGLGAGFAAYGIYPEFADYYALHIMYYTQQRPECRQQAEAALAQQAHIEHQEPIPTRATAGISDAPELWRYFVRPLQPNGAQGDDDVVISMVMDINRRVDGAYVFSSGKNMGAFKAVGHAEDVGRFYLIEEYRAYMWVAHGRFPTNTPGWWAGAHPFTILDWAVVHNGEISSYGINKRYLEMFGYKCTMRTDTEVMAYLLDLLMRKHGLPLRLAAAAMAPRFWEMIDRLDPQERELQTAIRQVYGSAHVNGPFAIIASNSRGMFGLNDRIKLRPMVAARGNNTLYIASEEAAIRAICPHPDAVWAPRAGEPVVGEVGKVRESENGTTERAAERRIQAVA
jgi:glutamate synthase domain-containing protein 1